MTDEEETPKWWSEVMMIGATGEAVDTVQRLLRCKPTGIYDHQTLARVRGFQVLTKRPPTGYVDRHTANALEHRRDNHGSLPHL